MLSDSKNFKATVSFGAEVDGSFGSSTAKINSDLNGIGNTANKLRRTQTAWAREMESGAVKAGDAYKKATTDVNSLARSQAALEKQIRAGVMAGKDVSRLTDRYQQLGKELDSATRKQERLNKEVEKETHEAERQAKVEKARQRFHGAAMAPVKLGTKGLKSAGGTLLSGVKWAGAGLFGGAAAAIASPIILNEQTAESASMANSYGVGIGTYQSMGILAKQAGLNAENAGDLSENLINNTAQKGNAKTINPMLAQIGLTQSRLNKMSKEQQFKLVMDRLSNMSDPKQSASLADQLMGGEANKMLTYLHTTKQTFEQAMNNASRFNLLTKDGADGAMAANTSVSNLWSVAITGMEDTVGKITGKLAPAVDGAALELADWIKGMEPKIEGAIGSWMKPDKSGDTGPQRLWKSMVKFADGTELIAKEIWAVAEKLKFVLPDEKTTEQKVQERMDIANAPTMWDDIKDKYHDHWMMKNQPLTPAGDVMPFNQRQQQTNQVSIQVYTTPGQAPEAVAQSIYQEFQKSLPGGGFNLSSGDTYDAPSTS